jgi:type II secretory pathway pseudopilin PulG
MKTPDFLEIHFLTPRRTVNAGAELRLSAFLTPNAPNIAGIRNDEWFVICPLGEFPSPDKSYTQVLTREQAEEVVRTWNSIPGTAARWFKNKWHKLKSTINGAPGWDGHPETDQARWPVERLLCEVTDLRVTDAGLEGKITWNEKGLERRTRGPLYPSPIFWHLPPNDQRKVFPVLLESIGLVPTPNISSVPAWTQNASPEAADNQPNENTMLKKLIEKLGLGASATEDEALAAVVTLQSTANTAKSDKDALTTANSAKADLEGKLTTANAKVTTLEGEKTALTTEVATLKTANGTLVEGVLDLFEAAGKFTPAQRKDVAAKFTANIADSAAVITELKEKKPEINTRPLELNGNRIDISTANARATALEAAISKRMKDDGIEDRGVAYDRVKADPNYKQLFEAMSDPTKAKAA